VTVFTWVGGTVGALNDPSKPSNWSGGVPPALPGDAGDNIDDVIIAAVANEPSSIPGILNSLTVVAGATLGTSGFIAKSIVNNGTISSGSNPGAFGVEIVPSTGTVTNAGTIIGGSFGIGVKIRAGGTVTNGAGAVITGGVQGILNNIAAAEIDNDGIIQATAAGGIGIQFADAVGDILTNAGTIIGNGAAAVQFGAGDDTLKLLPSAGFTGAVDGGTGVNTIELTAGAGAGDLTGIGSAFTNFGTVLLDGGAEWTLTGSGSDGLHSIAISGFNASDTIDLTGLAFSAVSGDFANNVLTVTNGITQAVLHIQGGFSSSDFVFSSDGATGTDVMLAPPPGTDRVHGLHTEYLIVNDNGTLVVDDTGSAGDGNRTLPGDDTVQFADGTGVFDPTGTAGTVLRLYQAALSRTPDLGGLQFWTGDIDNSHVSLADVANSFVASPEFIHNYGSLADADFIQQLYLNVLGRPGDPGGTIFWQSALNTGFTRGEVVIGFAESPEDRAKTVGIAGDKNDAEATRLYQAALNRAPDAGGEAFWSAALTNGETTTQVAQSFIDSTEFQQNFGTLDIPGFVSAMYQNVLHRAPDPGGQAFWNTTLQNGTSRADVLVDFSDSLENRTQTAAATHDGWVFIHA
jgi:Domain of unknown function (DUF4214)